jgi:dephospho-CoA kinase
MPSTLPAKPIDPAAARIMRERCVALTGGIATGKSTVADILRKIGYTVIDADELARVITSAGHPCLTAISAEFGASILTPAGELDRKALGQIVFSDPAQKRRLEAITHPAIQNEFARRVMAMKPCPELFFYEASLIFETGRQDMFREVWSTWCPENTQIARLMTRSHLAENEAEAIIAAQMPAREKADRAAVMIDTTGSTSDVAAKVKNTLRHRFP